MLVPFRLKIGELAFRLTGSSAWLPGWWFPTLHVCPDSIRLLQAKILLDDAWGIIANASGGDWGGVTMSAEWREAAARFRDELFEFNKARG